MRGKDERPMPDDFAEVAHTLNCAAIKLHYRMSGRTVSRLIGEMPVQWQLTRRDALLGRTEAQRLAQQANLIKANRAKALRGNARNVRMPHFRAIAGGPMEAMKADGLAARALDHLRRASPFRPCYDPSRINKAPALRGVFVVGRMRLDEPALLDLARKHGFQPDAWRQVSA
jgi:hypothetical protein